jgi:hypothetical protein
MVAGAATQQLSFGGRISRKLGLGAH